MSTSSIRKLSDRDHIRQRPAMYIGSVDLTATEDYILEDDKIIYKEISYVPGLIKIGNELIDNSVDVAIKSNFKFGNIISVKMDHEKMIVEDNGSGIPITKNDGHYLPELCWNHARAGSNFDDDENRTQIGMNGVGSYATACFSTKFTGETNDGKTAYKIDIVNGAERFKETLDYKGKQKQGTRVTFYPDLEMFKLTEIDETHQMVIKQRLINLSMTFPKITFKFNGRKINSGSFKSYLKLFNDNFEMYETEKYRFAILPNDADDFRHFSYVNGLKIPDGGMHITAIWEPIVNGIRNKLVKKYKTIKPGDIKNKIMIVAFLKDLPNAKFNSQNKEKITNSYADINKYYSEETPIPWDSIVSKLLKNTEIIEAITELYRAKEEMQRRKDLKNADKKTKKKPESEKFMPPIGAWDSCYVCEGDSAKNSISKLLGRDGKGFYAMFGVPLNAYDAPMSKIMKSVKMMDLKDILGLQFSETEQHNLHFKNIVITTDYDLPGHFIAGQLLGLLYRFGKNLFDEGRVKRLVTPLMIATDSRENIKAWFYTFEDYKAFEKVNRSKNLNYDYKKGLGSWDAAELETVIAKDGLDNMLETYTLDDVAESKIEGWLGSDAQKRKDFLNGVEFDMMSV